MCIKIEFLIFGLVNQMEKHKSINYFVEALCHSFDDNAKLIKIQNVDVDLFWLVKLHFEFHNVRLVNNESLELFISLIISIFY